MSTAGLFMLVLVSTLCTAQHWEHAPKPEDYLVSESFTGTPRPPVLTTKKAKLYRTVLRQGASQGPNFAGHYTVVAWGCGMDSFELAVVDAKTGTIHFPPFGCLTLAGGFGLPTPERASVTNPAYRTDSKLLVVVGVEDSDTATPEARAAKFYVFDKGQFRLVYSIPAPM
jgi:hypothetical protein